MVNSIKILLHNNPNAVYYSDDVITGYIMLKLDGRIKKVKSLKLSITGIAVGRWTKSGCRDEHRYQNSLTWLGSKTGGKDLKVNAGEHNYDFKCQLPSPLPYSVYEKYGRIRYILTAKLDLPWLSALTFDMQTHRIITVVRCEDLNRFREVNLACEAERVKTFGFWCFKSDQLVIKVSLPRTGFALGEKIPVTVKLQNDSRTDVISVNYALKRIERFIEATSYPSVDDIKEVKTKIVEQFTDGAKRRQHKAFVEFIEIPTNLLISNERLSSEHQTAYELKITVVTNSIIDVGSPYIRVPITIGPVGQQSQRSAVLSVE